MRNARGFLMGAGAGLLAAFLVVGIVFAGGGVLFGQPGASAPTQHSEPATAGSQEGLSGNPQPPPPGARVGSPSSIVTLETGGPYALGWAALPFVLAIALGAAAYQLYSRRADAE